MITPTGNKLNYVGENLVYEQVSPQRLPELEEQVAQALESTPGEIPLSSCVVAGDRVVLAIDPQVPCLENVLPPILNVLEQAGVNREDITLLISSQGKPAGIRSILKEHLIRSLSPGFPAAQILEHDYDDAARLKYLASTATATPIMLNEKLVEADFVLPIGLMCYDRFYGVRNGNSVLYPGFSSRKDALKGMRQGHQELAPGEDFPLQQLADEAGWLLGSVMSLQLIPGSAKSIAGIHWGQIQALTRISHKVLAPIWGIPHPQRVETLLADISGYSPETVHWVLAESLARCRQLTQRGGRIYLYSDIKTLPEQLTDLFQGELKSSESLQRLGRDDMTDPWKMLARTILETVDWCHVYLASELPLDLVRRMLLLPFNYEDAEFREKLEKSAEVLLLKNPLYVRSLS